MYLTQRKKGRTRQFKLFWVIYLTRIYSLSLHLLPDCIPDTLHVSYTLHINYIHTCSYLTQRKKGRAGQFKLFRVICLTRIYSLSLHLLPDCIPDTPHVSYTLHINYIHTCSYLTQRKKGRAGQFKLFRVICLTRIYSLSLHLLPDCIPDTPHVRYTLHINYIHTCSYLTQRKKGRARQFKLFRVILC